MPYVKVIHREVGGQGETELASLNQTSIDIASESADTPIITSSIFCIKDTVLGSGCVFGRCGGERTSLEILLDVSRARVPKRQATSGGCRQDIHS